MGSGSLAAMAVFESRWKPNMNVSFQLSFLTFVGKESSAVSSVISE
jgi:hypothetical protein